MLLDDCQEGSAGSSDIYCISPYPSICKMPFGSAGEGVDPVGVVHNGHPHVKHTTSAIIITVGG